MEACASRTLEEASEIEEVEVKEEELLLHKLLNYAEDT